MDSAAGAALPRCTIGLLWHSIGHGNLGVDALTRSHIAILQAAADRAGIAPDFVLLEGTASYAMQAAPANVRKAPRLRLKEVALGRSGFLKAMRACDVVLDISEGDSFADIYGLLRFFLQFGTKTAAVLYGKRLVLAPQTIGPFERGWTRVLARGLLRRCAHVYARDALTLSVVRDLGLARNVGEAIDVAFRLPFTPPSREAGGPIRVGMNVSGLLFNQGYTGKNEFGMTLDYAALTRRLIEHFRAMPGVEIWLVPHVDVANRQSPDTDVPVSETLAGEYPGVHVAGPFATSIEAKTFIAGLDFMTAGRMHASIAAFSASVPVVPIAYSRKFNGLFGTLGYPHYVDGRAQSAEDAFARIRDAFDQRDALRATIADGLTLARTRLAAYEDFLVSYLTAQRKR